jgi:nucleoside-diphosphate-sugar epimerase
MEYGKAALEGLGLMKVFIAGGTGFIGSSVVRRFLKESAEVHIMIRKTSNLWRIKDIKNQINLHYGDLSFFPIVEGIISTIRPEVVINCSGIVKGFSLDDQDHVIQSNLLNTVNVVNASLRSNVETFINTGTAYECGFSHRPITNANCVRNPIGLYGIVKKAESQYVKMIAQNYSKMYLNFRLFTPYGFFDTPNKLIPYVIISLIHGRVPEVKNSAAGRSFIFIEDVSKVYYAAAKNPEKLDDNTVINLGAPNLTINAEVVSLLYGIFNLKYTFKAKDDNLSKEYLFPDPEETIKFLSLLKVSLTPLHEGLEKTVKWFIENESLYGENSKEKVARK